MWKDAEDFLSKDKYIGPLIKSYGSCTLRPRQRRYYFEDLVDAIIQQQLSMSAASSIFNKIKKKIFSRNSPNKNQDHRWRAEKTLSTRVTPEKILAISDNEFRECGLSKAKILYIRDLAKKVASGKLQVKLLDKLSDEKVTQELTRVKGIGVWTAQMFLMFTLARPDVFPVGDLGLRNAFKKVLGKDLIAKQMEKFALRWKPYRTIASWYLWKSLEG